MHFLLFIFILQDLFRSYQVVFEEKFSDAPNLDNWIIEEIMDISGSCSLYRNNRSNVFVDSEGLHLKVTRGEFSKCPRGLPFPKWIHMYLSH